MHCRLCVVARWGGLACIRNISPRLQMIQGNVYHLILLQCRPWSLVSASTMQEPNQTKPNQNQIEIETDIPPKIYPRTTEACLQTPTSPTVGFSKPPVGMRRILKLQVVSELHVVLEERGSLKL